MSETHDDAIGWTRLDYSAPDGLRLAGRKYGWQHDNRLPVLCLAGLTRNSADFHHLAMYLSRWAPAPRRVLCLDYRGRGMSQRDRDWQNYNPLTEADDVLAGVTAAGLREVAIVGTSRGGLIAMVLAALRPAVMRAVVLNDVGPEIDGRGLVRIRNYVEKGRDFASWREAVEAVRAMGESQFPVYDRSDWEAQARLIFEERKGRIVRRYDPRLMKSLATINLDNPLPTMWPQFAGLRNIPVLLLRGERSDLLSPETVERMHDLHPAMRSVTVAGQGHAPDLGSDGLPERVAAFIEAAEAEPA